MVSLLPSNKSLPSNTYLHTTNRNHSNTSYRCEQASMYIRVKRLKTTAFLHVEPTDTVASIKAKIHDLLQQPPDNQQLYKDGTLLEDGRSLVELKIETDDVITLALKQPGKFLFNFTLSTLIVYNVFSPRYFSFICCLFIPCRWELGIATGAGVWGCQRRRLKNCQYL